MSESNSPSSNFFSGVNFVLFGFDPVEERKARSKLIDGGGVDVGQYGPSCTHVIVDKLCYDDPECVAARNDGKKLVSKLWVDHSFDIGMVVDTDSIMYRPLKDLGGIPGAKSLIICLTGYLRQDRDDIMTMVGLIGAQFSKPLVANKVTHLICYKFEGEKYELAKKMKRIKLVNHLWLEESLRDWVLHPEAKYDKSGYELEMMEAQANDSEDEGERTSLMQSEERNVNKTPLVINSGTHDGGGLPKAEGAELQSTSSMVKDASNSGVVKDQLNSVKVNHTGNVPLHHGYRDTRAIGDAAASSHERTSKSVNVDNCLDPTSISAERPFSLDTTYNATSYSRKTPMKSPVSMFQEESVNNLSSYPKANVSDLKRNGDLGSSSKANQKFDQTGSVSFGTPRGKGDPHNEESRSILSQKRRTPTSVGSSKSLKLGHNSKERIRGSLSDVNKSEGSERGTLERDDRFFFANDDHSKDKIAARDSCASDLAFKTSSLTNNLLIDDPPVSGSLTSRPLPNGTTEENAGEPSSAGLTKSTMSRVPNDQDFGADIYTTISGEAKDPPNQLLDVDPSLSNRKSVLEDFERVSNSDVLQVGNSKLATTKPLRKKTLARKTLGSWAKLNDTGNLKGFVCSSKDASENNFEACYGEEKSAAVQKNVDKCEITPPAGIGMAVTSNLSLRTDAVQTTESVDDETQEPEEKDECAGLQNTLNQDKADTSDLSHIADLGMIINSTVQQIENDLKASSTSMHDGAMESEDKTNRTAVDNTVSGKKVSVDESTLKGNVGKKKIKKGNKKISGTTSNASSKHDDAMVSEDKTNGIEVDMTVSGKNIGMSETTLKGDLVKKKIKKGNKGISGKSKVDTVPAVKELAESMVETDGEETRNAKDMEMEEKILMHPVANSEGTVSVNKLGNSGEVDDDDESTPVLGVKQNSSRNLCGKKKVKSSKTPKNSKNSGKVETKLMSEKLLANKRKAEPALFTFSGHRLQRKEFQQIIKRLKGRCRDSHQWTYQVTHFITTDLKRTEKLFAAAASGRWILQSDYLSACNQAGKFLPEEPFEWHKKGLSEDGAINLEAPRKWRLLRQRTGHGAFYGMHIVVYGECISPSLETLKRVVKAGDGTILATSPPYTRFLDSGNIDFAIISPGMPRVDMWVQEFLKHEIPCVLADYLVEYVCKTGYSLEKHVLYNTHAWAEKSLSNMVSRAEEEEEVAEDLATTPDDSASDDDITCEICGSRDRAEVMLICGDESGKKGCGIGTHIDCCDPPFDQVPKEDWFCPKCNEANNSSNSRKKRRQGTSSSKHK